MQGDRALPGDGQLLGLDVEGEVDVLVSNRGGATAVAPFEVVVFDDTDGSGDFGVADGLLGSVMVTDDLSSAATRTVTVPVSIPASATIPLTS